MAFCKGVRACLPCKAVRTISPYNVSAPVKITRSEPLPVSTRVPALTQCPSSTGISGSLDSNCATACLRTGYASPVSADSSTWINSAWIRIPSAGTFSPDFNNTRSPGTNSVAATSSSTPPRRTRVVAASRLASPAIEAWVRRCRYRSMPIRGNVAINRMIASVLFPKKKNKTAVATRNHNMGSRAVSETRSSQPVPASARILFAP